MRRWGSTTICARAVHPSAAHVGITPPGAIQKSMPPELCALIYVGGMANVRDGGAGSPGGISVGGPSGIQIDGARIQIGGVPVVGSPGSAPMSPPASVRAAPPVSFDPAYGATFVVRHAKLVAAGFVI